ncbi:unnamed protein product [Callosobruchus maculatus]|uniref:Protein TsetseEP domain-containing protein n=1 Tax=Callosobruchus maculatus TaxID=64391 RepID=A0A653BMW3_CALMS|nr:unnamed protein product [Callosobruchus maculatus]
MALKIKLVLFLVIICVQHLQVYAYDDYTATARRVIQGTRDLEEFVQNKVDKAEETIRQTVQDTKDFVEGLGTYLSSTAKSVFEFHDAVISLRDNATSHNITEDVCPIGDTKARVDDLPSIFANHTRQCRTKVNFRIQEQMEGAAMEITRINYETIKMIKKAMSCVSNPDYPNCVVDMEANLTAQQTVASQQIANVIFDTQTKLNGVKTRGLDCVIKAVDEELLDTGDYIAKIARCIRQNILKEIYGKEVVLYVPNYA